MQTSTDKLVDPDDQGYHSELSSVAFTIATGGITAGLKVSIFFTSAAIDLVHRRRPAPHPGRAAGPVDAA